MAGKNVILDTNLLVLFVVGITDPKYIAIHKRLQDYNKNDFSLLSRLVLSYESLVLNPHVLAETSNLAGQITGPAKSKIYGKLGELIENCHEAFIESKRGVRLKEYRDLGVTDAVLLCASRDEHVIATVDGRLYGVALSLGYRAINFNHRDMVRRKNT